MKKYFVSPMAPVPGMVLRLVRPVPAFVLLLASSQLAYAQPAAGGAAPGSCPPGSWFCSQAPQPPSAPAGEPGESLEPLPSPEVLPPPPPRPPPRERPRPPAPPRTGPPPPLVTYAPPPPPDMWRPEMPPPAMALPRREPLSPASEWGLNAHLEAAMIGRGVDGNASMGGAGAGLRFKPSRAFGIEGDFDFVGGTDYAGNSRSERAFSLNALLFLNPRSHAQLYVLAGFGWAGASVQDAQSQSLSYSYFGGQIGAGLEIRLTRSLALDGDLRGFLRNRTDALAQTQPEFTDQNGRTTNTSGGGLLTAGMTLYF
jgi:hypothetical protein